MTQETKKNDYKSFEDVIEDWRKYCSYFRHYPDKFIDFITPKETNFKLLFFQRMFLRFFFRYQTCFMVFTRGSSKSFVQVLALVLKCIMYPGSKLFICAPGREQSAGIAKEKLEEIFNIWPIIRNEVSDYRMQQEVLEVKFRNGSFLDVIPISAGSRGRRRHGGSIEEICEMDSKKEILNDVILPTMQIDRRSYNNQVDPNEIKKFTLYLTTAGTRQSFAFEKAKAVLNDMRKGRNVVYIGAGYELGVTFGLFDEDYIRQAEEDPTKSYLGFLREYRSVWTGSTERSFVKQTDLEACRTLKRAEFNANKEKYPDAEYVISYDVARAEGKANDESAISVFRIIPRGDGTYRKQLVFLKSFEGRHFLEQAKYIKSKVNEYNARAVCIDTNAIGYGLVDFLTTEIDENPPYSVINDDRYDEYKKPNSVPMLYLVKGQSKETYNADIFNVFANYISKKDVQFLIPEVDAKMQIVENKKFKNVDPEKLAELLYPHILTDHLMDEILNHEYKLSHTGKVVLRRISTNMGRDKFMSVAYGLYYIYKLEQENINKHKEEEDPASFFFVSKARF